MVKKADLNINCLKDDLKALKECWDIKEKNQDEKLFDIIADSCVKRFEYTIETAWKIMKKYLKLEYGKEDKELTINNIFRFMAGYEMIESWERWKEYYAQRNNSAHEYNIKKSREILKFIPEFIKDTDILIKNLEKNIDD